MPLPVFGQRDKWYVGALCRDARPAPATERLRAALRKARRAALRARVPALCVLAALLAAFAAAYFAGRPSSGVVESAGRSVVVTLGTPAPGQYKAVYTRRDLLLGTLLLVDPAHPLPDDFPGANARDVTRMVGSYLNADEGVALREEAVYALCAMREKRPLDEALFSRGAVSYAGQNALRREAFSRYLAVGTVESALGEMNKNVPRAGESEHQTGLSVDVELLGALSYAADDPLLGTETGRWISENMADFGFIRRYRAAGEAGGCEGVHLRYVGKVHALAMRAGGWTLEEYLSALRENGGMTVAGEGFLAYIYAFNGDAGGCVSVAEDAEISVSADNTGWTIVTAVTKR